VERSRAWSAAPKSLSLLRAYGDDVVQKAVLDAHNTGVREAMEYIHTHAGYTRVHNNITGRKDLQRLPGLVAAVYQHETSRAGDPHLHAHVIVPNKQARVDGKLAAVDTDSLWHESKAGGVIYQATMRRQLTQSIGAEWGLVDPYTGMAEIVGIDPEVIKAHSRRSTQLRAWADDNLTLIDGEPTQAQLAIARIDVENGRSADAAAPLSEVMNKSKDSELRQIARLRLARVLIDQGKPDEAIKTLAEPIPATFAARYREVRGDAYLAKKDTAHALAEYQQALGAADMSGMNASLLELKIQDLGAVPTPVVNAVSVDTQPKGNP